MMDMITFDNEFGSSLRASASDSGRLESFKILLSCEITVTVIIEVVGVLRRYL